MIVGTVIGCIIAVVLGKRAVARGDNFVKQRDEWLQKALLEDEKKGK